MTWEIILILMSLMKNKLEFGLFKKIGLARSKNIGHYCFKQRMHRRKFACCIFLTAHSQV